MPPDGATPSLDGSTLTRRRALATLGSTAVVSTAGCAGRILDDSAREPYEREFEPLEDQSTEVGAVYMPFFDEPRQWRECAVGEPAVGTYDMGDAGALDRHGDLTQGFGISRLQFDIFEPAQTSPFLETRRNTLLSDTPLEAMYVVSNSMRWRGSKSVREQLDDCLETIRDDFFAQENYAERDGRPTVKFWNIPWVAWGGNEDSAAVREYVRSEWDDFEAFGAYLRDQLTADGVEPYLVGGFGRFGRAYAKYGGSGGGQWIEDVVSLARAFDAVSNWTGNTRPNETVTQEEHLAFQEETFAGFEQLAADLDVEFVPVVQPGFDDRANDCWGADKFVPRSPDHFEALFELAEEYGTTDRIDVASFNDWGEGHQIEPGTYDGEGYGTEYLEVVKSVAASNP